MFFQKYFILNTDSNRKLILTNALEDIENNSIYNLSRVLNIMFHELFKFLKKKNEKLVR